MSNHRAAIRGRVLTTLAPAFFVGVISVTMASRVETTEEDFFQPGTQPETINAEMFEAVACRYCHGDYDLDQAPFNRWAASMMAQAARDPIFQACLTIANQDLNFSGDLCLRCHSPVGWLEGRSNPPDGSGLIAKDMEGVNCHVCHRLVDPVYDLDNPPVDLDILADLGVTMPEPHTGQYVVDPEDRRRGPFELDPNFPWHDWRRSPFHQDSLLCATCHDVSNPGYVRQPDGTYVLGEIDEPHPTHDKLDEFPLERTYSEWAMSAFADGPIDMGGRFGGNKTAVSSCQDCHMPDITGYGCNPGLKHDPRDDLPMHTFAGANTWVLEAIRSLYDDFETGLTDQTVADAIAFNEAMLAAASDVELEQIANVLRVRVINQTGHKLPTGYPEGRRMWVNVRFYDESGALLREHGAYDPNTAVLVEHDTKVYEGVLGLDEAVAKLTDLPPGPSFHFALNNLWIKDNRIPPRGFTNAGFEAVQAQPVGYDYADGQYWDDTEYVVPRGAYRAAVRVYYQTTTREYIEFLRDENTTDDRGQLAYDLWEQFGKSAPAEMDDVERILDVPGDLDGDRDVDLTDLSTLLSAFGSGDAGDLDGDGDTDLSDLSVLLAYYGT